MTPFFHLQGTRSYCREIAGSRPISVLLRYEQRPGLPPLNLRRTIWIKRTGEIVDIPSHKWVDGRVPGGCI